MALMDKMVKSIKREKREEMMIDMMPLMMDGIDMNELMPKMVANMLKDLTADQIVTFLSGLINDSSVLSKLGTKVAEANLMSKMMMKTWVSKFSFEETIEKIRVNAPKNNWHIPDERDIQKLWCGLGVENATKMHTLYFCNAEGGSTVTADDELKCMSVMMPMGVSVYETSEGEVWISAMNISMMSLMFSGSTKKVFANSGINLENTLNDIVN